MMRVRWQIMRWAGLTAVAALLAIASSGCETERAVTEDPAAVGVSGEIINVTEATFEEKVLEAEVPVLVDFYADWCPPCRMLEPTLEEIAADYAGRAMVAKVDVDENPDLAARYEVRGIPALFIIKGGEVVDQATGVQPKRTLEQMLDRQLD